MTTKRAMVVCVAAALAAAAASAPDTAPPARRLSRGVLEEKVRGGWAGQMIGVSFGAPTEFRFQGRTIEGPIAWKPEDVSNAIDQDDLYLEQWTVDPPTARIAFGDPAWTWSAGWSDAKDDERSSGPTMKAADKTGAEAILKFRGTGLSVAGPCSPQGGRADVCLDGEKVGEIDAYVVPRTHDNDTGM